MFKKGGEIAIPCLTDWRDALDRPGANCIKHIRSLFEARSISGLIPDQSVIYGINPEDENYIAGSIASDNSFIMIYLANGQNTWVVTKKIKDKELICRWYNPGTGEISAGQSIENKSLMEFVPPVKGTDWILLIDSKQAKLNIP